MEPPTNLRANINCAPYFPAHNGVEYGLQTACCAVFLGHGFATGCLRRSIEGSQEVSVSVTLNRMVIDGGEDVTNVLGEEVRSENALPMPHVAKVEMIH